MPPRVFWCLLRQDEMGVLQKYGCFAVLIILFFRALSLPASDVGTRQIRAAGWRVRVRIGHRISRRPMLAIYSISQRGGIVNRREKYPIFCM